jgi:hypothetical protein
VATIRGYTHCVNALLATGVGVDHENIVSVTILNFTMGLMNTIH